MATIKERLKGEKTRIIFNIVISILYLICALVELITVICLLGEIGIICVERFEISAGMEQFIVCIGMPIVTDCIYALFGLIFFNTLYCNPFNIFYNFIMGILCLIAFTNQFTTKCPYQENIRICLLLVFGFPPAVLVAAIAHIVIAILSSVLMVKYQDWYILWEERFCMDRWATGKSKTK